MGSRDCSPRMVMEARLCGAGLPIPAVTICVEDVIEGKPSPGGFLAAARRLAVDPRHCLGFEDSTAGFQVLTEAGINQGHSRHNGTRQGRYRVRSRPDRARPPIRT
ncbi:hypothetical protein HMPREF0183_1029 [Brevibacterium mcbrellneri ATCC 49030]|uniref:HAD hydrolase, family IA, variant 3 n=2 Tax=Brevibacterium TaxID=1696 RepID=D4YM69_9MICO|nr:hypothetical protein HMPREF0183_1029 [Brevibacterium mcbrellneri ATCC 49030]